jgi:tetratricopeptide (TPR) repeat protein
MFSQFTKRHIVVAATIFPALLLLVSCGPKSRTALSQLDTPGHHFAVGTRLLDQAKYVDAGREYDFALQLNPKYAKALAGKALMRAYQLDFTRAFEMMKTAWKYAGTDDEKFLFHVNYIRIYTLSASECLKAGIRAGAVCTQQPKWLEFSKDEYKAAVLINPKSGAPPYFMGLAYQTAMDLKNAAQMFAKTLDLNRGYTKEADAQWSLVQKIQRAMPETITGKKIAFVEELTRADAAALFMEELKINALYKKRSFKTFDTAFQNLPKAGDIAAHPLKADIEGILQLGVRGLEVFSDGAFHPDEPISRASYAMMLEDILMKVSGDNKPATKVIGDREPSFSDLRADLPYYNAVRVVTSRGIMEAKDQRTGEFDPMGTVAGADALLIIRRFIEKAKID